MAITLADVQTDDMIDFDFQTIDEIRRASPGVLNSLQFSNTVIPGEGDGGTLIAGYTRIESTRPAHTRQINTEYPAFEARKRRITVELVPMGARYNIDRVAARLGRTSEVQFQQRMAVNATVQKFHDLFINGVPSDFSTENPQFEGLDSIIAGTATDWYDGTDPWDFSGVNSQASAVVADLELRNWMRRMEGLRSVPGDVAFLVNNDGAAWLDRINAFRSLNTTVENSFGQSIPLYGGLPYYNMGLKPGTITEEGFIAGTSGEEVIETNAEGVTTIYAVRFGLDAVHGYSVPAGDQGNVDGGGLFAQWLPRFDADAGAVKPGEVELGPVAIAAKSTLSVGAFRVKVQ